MINRTRVLVAMGLMASMVPFGGGAADAAPVRAAAQGYGGFTSEAWASPLRIELYEPSIPIPADPQAEAYAGYSKVKADSGMSQGKASWFWPGDPVGEGMRTFGGAFGLPEDNPITGPGYRLQVNSQYPGDPATAKDQPAPGMVMRTTSGDKTARAETGFSPDGAVLGPEAGDAPEGEGEGGGAENPLSGLQDQLTNLLGGAAPAAASSKSEPAAETPEAPPGLEGLEALVDLDGYVSVSKMSATESPVVGAARTELGSVRLLGGMITLGGLETVAKATSDGAKGVATGKATWGKLTIAGNEFSMGPDGPVAAGNPAPIPGLDALPLDALKQLGITIEAPKGKRTVDGDKATSVFQALRVIIDTKTLSPVLQALPASQLSALVPAEAGPLKSLVSGLSTLAPRIVMTFGVASASVDTVPKMSFPPPPGGEAPAAPPAEGGAAAGGGAAGGAASGAPGGAAAPAGSGVGAAGGAGDAGAGATGNLPPVNQTAGLPELFSIPGMLLVAAFAAAAVAGSWFRRIGAAALGGGAPCSHGLDSGLPDLRKA